MKSSIDAIKEAEIRAIVSVGGSLRTAAKHVGCTVSAIRVRADRSREFAQRLKRAESDFEVILLSNIQQAGKKSWNASAWLLERIFPERFAKRRPGTIPVEELNDVFEHLATIITHEVADPERCERLLDRVTKLLANLAAEPKRKKKRK
ncbi:MAG TPA: hypothetical protein VGN12_10455 [Pirellulales bacterium]|jgi:hypothetical protein